ncbi:glycerophosphodiester phosphodiesterase family protein [Chitinophaga pendula]|uniref:glycerophosphodiester phosphodiesterase family protein n=1 Tax=Chitinophaga TaxID=79328 RepID=UPI000BAFAA30|nr:MULTISPECIES: glycerophosphodiester phosphodiesterase family protein [Chitinophaga]ASZ12285.1 glycerophosphodiester phosphodiesterase [Chitinophaga sp. MD30]UCJ10126.1 glycerophosphodiester phosphodiesterase family protein [Chitinophaga pendula]
MRHLLCYCLLVAILPVVGQKKPAAVKTYQQLIERMQRPSPTHVLAVAHRGDWRNAPENSLNAIARCIEMGIDIVEIDVRRTKDGQLILMHDETIDRTTTGKGKVADCTLDSIRKVQLRQGNGVPVPERVPTLEEVLLFIKGKPVLLNLDKSWDWLEETYAVLRKTGTVGQGIFKGNQTLETLRQLHGGIMDSIHYMPMVWSMDYNIYGATAKQPMEYVREFAQQYVPIGFEVNYNKESSPVLEQAIPAIRGYKKTVWVNTLWDALCAGHSDEAAIDDPEANWGWVIRHGANVIQTDRPVELLAYLRKKGLHE